MSFWSPNLCVSAHVMGRVNRKSSFAYTWLAAITADRSCYCGNFILSSNIQIRRSINFSTNIIVIFALEIISSVAGIKLSSLPHSYPRSVIYIHHLTIKWNHILRANLYHVDATWTMSSQHVKKNKRLAYLHFHFNLLLNIWFFGKKKYVPGYILKAISFKWNVTLGQVISRV